MVRYEGTAISSGFINVVYQPQPSSFRILKVPPPPKYTPGVTALLPETRLPLRNPRHKLNLKQA